jgi:hypothetical protein
MNRPRRVLVMLLVAGVLPGSTLVLGQAGQSPPSVPSQAAPEAKKQAAPLAKTKRSPDAEKKPTPKKAVMMREAIVLRPARVVGRVAAQPVAAVLDAQAAQYVEQFRPMFRAEYYFTRNVCSLTVDQRKQLARLGEGALRAAARQFVESQQTMMRGGWRPGMENPDPRKFLEAELTKSAMRLLSPDQQARLRKELEERAASRRQVFVDNLVAKLDGDLVLTADQRDRLVKALSANWNDAWGQSLQMLQNLDSFFPNIPDQVVAPILTDNQKEVWRRIPKNQNVFWGFSFDGGMMGNDPLDDPEFLEAQKEAQAARKEQ